jgi:hypothetical protein
VEALGALLRPFEADLPEPLSPAQVFDLLAAVVPRLAGLRLAALPPHGVSLGADLAGDGDDPPQAD